VTTSNILEADVKRTMVQRASRVVLMADSSKFGRVLSLAVTPLEKLDTIISDLELSDADAEHIQRLDIEVIRV
jgi:DeoR/GlpR family transcriptional regulator of sugar metabolism